MTAALPGNLADPETSSTSEVFTFHINFIPGLEAELIIAIAVTREFSV